MPVGIIAYMEIVKENLDNRRNTGCKNLVHIPPDVGRHGSTTNKRRGHDRQAIISRICMMQVDLYVY